MADIDFITDVSTGEFRITLGDNPNKVVGNRALVNRFEITFLTKTKLFLEGSTFVIDNYGGNAEKFINRPHVLNDLQSISAAIATSMDQTVQSMKNDEPVGIPNTEKIAGADLVSVDVVNDTVVATIKINPVETETLEALMFNLPIIRM